MNDVEYIREPLTERLTVEIGASLRRDLARLAEEDNRPLAFVARQAIAAVVAKRVRKREQAEGRAA
jgi:predicted transcriptional regulator